MSSSSIASRSATRRNIFESPPDPKLPSNAADPVADPPPTPRPVSQLLAFGLIIVLALLQFLPATHFRDASDPFRKWVAFDSFVSFASLYFVCSNYIQQLHYDTALVNFLISSFC